MIILNVIWKYNMELDYNVWLSVVIIESFFEKSEFG